MPLYYFDVENGGRQRDDTSVECRDLREVRDIAMRALPDIVGQEAGEGERHTVTVVVRDAANRPVFATTLTLTGLWLLDRNEG